MHQVEQMLRFEIHGVKYYKDYNSIVIFVLVFVIYFCVLMKVVGNRNQ